MMRLLPRLDSYLSPVTPLFALFLAASAGCTYESDCLVAAEDGRRAQFADVVGSNEPGGDGGTEVSLPDALLTDLKVPDMGIDYDVEVAEEPDVPSLDGEVPTDAEVGGEVDSGCIPDCLEIECGDDGCGGSCGDCVDGESCQKGQCESACGDEACDGLEQCDTCPVDCGSCISAGFVKVDNGSFWMGSPAGCPGPEGYDGDCTKELGHSPVEVLHYVKLTRDFEMEVTEVTQGAWKSAFEGWNPSFFPHCGDNCPVEGVSWFDSVAYANRKSEAAGLTPCYLFSGVKCLKGGDPADGSEYEFCLDAFHGGIDKASVSIAGAATPYDCEGYRLPMEAEWEYAARAGSLTAIYPSDGNDGSLTQGGKTPLDLNLDQIAWYGGNSKATYEGAVDCSGWYPAATTCGPQPVGTKEGNEMGLEDMAGNVREWCWDLDSPYPVGSKVNPAVDHNASVGNIRVCRGGSWDFLAIACRPGNHCGDAPDYRSDYLGLRLARTL